MIRQRLKLIVFYINILGSNLKSNPKQLNFKEKNLFINV
jgi:hypothetical protein